MRNWLIILALIVPSVATPAAACAPSSSAAVGPIPQPTELHQVASTETTPQIIFLQNGQTIQGETIEPHGEQLRVQTPGGPIDLPSSRVLSIHPMDSPTGSPPSRPPPRYIKA